MSSAYLFVSHGSRDPRPQIAVEHLARLVAQRLTPPLAQPLRELRKTAVLTPEKPAAVALPVWMGTATLELGPIPLHQRIEQFALQVQSAGLREVWIIPLFLHCGVHVREDIPAEVALARQALGDRIALKLEPYLGSYPEIETLLAAQLNRMSASGRILLAHGSRRPGGNQPIEAIASQVNALAAYWSVAPSLEDRLARLVGEGHANIAIIPYFLFAGGITTAIADRVRQLEGQFPHAQLLLGQPLGRPEDLAPFLVKNRTKPRSRSWEFLK